MTDIYEVIQTASDQHVRTLLRLLCDSDYNIKSRTAEFHGMIENLQPTVTTSSSLLINNHNHNDSTCCSISSDRKRKRDPLEIFYCVNCKECFMDEENDDEACSYHPGEFDPDRDDFFADHDDEIHGRKLKSSGSDDDDDDEEEEEEKEEEDNGGRRENGEGGTDDTKENSNEKDGGN
ncbi:hypothetical protein TWF102_003857 [Orbilia oligospora]|uniref:C2H2-type domain-containing protein n=1 Tax=Orbilia oligospora TaxID=2813651 RepID=A0A7C8N5K9_ORBOL|nr:hypothetical protein TWF102_003857 [Orbilia oligospora]